LSDIYEDHKSHVTNAGLHIMLGAFEHCRTEIKWLKRLYNDVIEGNFDKTGVPPKDKEEP